jgi:hypothetical protein
MSIRWPSTSNKLIHETEDRSTLFRSVGSALDHAWLKSSETDFGFDAHDTSRITKWLLEHREIMHRSADSEDLKRMEAGVIESQHPLLNIDHHSANLLGLEKTAKAQNRSWRLGVLA